jgi:hypothetical protein
MASQQQAGTVPVEVVHLVTQFLTSLQREKLNEAWDGVVAQSPLQVQSEGIAESKRQAQAQLAAIGPVLDFEPLGYREVGPSLVVMKCLVRHERDALTWAFSFYKPRDRWMLTSLRWFPSAAYLTP